MANSIEYIQNTSNISSITSLENNEKFITIKYLNNYNSILCKNIIDVVNATIMNSSNIGCLFINENENILSFHFQRDDNTSTIFNVEEDILLNKTIFLDKLKYFKLPANLHLIYTENFATSGLDGTPDTLSISIDDGSVTNVDEWAPIEYPLISITNGNSNYRINIGNSNGDDANKLNINFPSINSATLTSSIFTGTLKGTVSGIDAQGSSDSKCTLSRMSLDSTCSIDNSIIPDNFPRDIILDLGVNYFSDRNTLMFIDHIGGIYRPKFNNCKILKYSVQGGHQYIEDNGLPSQPIINAIIPLGTCYAISNHNNFIGNNIWLQNFPYGIENNIANNICEPLFTPINITNILKNSLHPELKPDLNVYEYYDFDSWRDGDRVGIAPGSIIILNLDIMHNGSPTCVYFERIDDYPLFNETEHEYFNNDIPKARVFRNQFKNPNFSQN